MDYILKTLIILVVSSLSITGSQAQKYNSFAGVRVGYALPLGQLASHEFETGGYALLGKSIALEAAWFIKPKLGFGFDISTKSFGFASGYYAEDLKENTPEYTSPVDMLSGPYKVTTYMAGVYYKTEIIKKLYSSFKLMGGVLVARTPDQFYGCDIFIKGPTYWWKTGSLDRTFGLLAGASIEYRLFDHVSLLLQSNFSYAQSAFVYDNGNELYTVEMQMPIFELLPGINIHF